MYPHVHQHVHVWTPHGGRDDDAVLSDLSSSDEDAVQIKVPLSKDEALAAVQRSKVLKGLSIPGQAGRGHLNSLV